MAVSIVLTGTGQNCSLVLGSNSITVTNVTGLVVGAPGLYSRIPILFDFTVRANFVKQ